MASYIGRRLLQMIVLLGILSFVCYTMLSLMPGDPVEILASSNPKITTEDIERLRALYGLDQPAYLRFWNWLSDTLSGDLGYSRTYHVPVTDLIGPRLFNTFLLSMTSLTLAVVLGISVGVYAALKQGSWFDYIANFFAFAAFSMPAFWLAIVLIIIFAVYLPKWTGVQWLPAGGTYTIGSDLSGWENIVDRAKYLILPTLSLTCLQMGVFVRFARSSMLEAMRNDFIRTAKAKGMSRVVVVWTHGFRNALIPLITMVALSLSSLFSGAVLTETVFGYQGVGSLIYNAIIGSDFNLAMVSFLITIAMVLVMNLVADILYGVADPRITYN